MPKVAFPPILAALRWRTASSAALLAVAVLAIFTAAAGPLFLGAADTEVLHTQLTQAGPSQTAVSVANPTPGANSTAAFGRLDALARQLGLNRWYEAPVYTQDYGALVSSNHADLVYRTGVCDHLHFISGSCPSSVGKIAMSDRDARRLKVKVGDLVDVPGAGQLRVSGITSVPRLGGAYWLGNDFFQFSPPSLKPLPSLDAFFATAATLATLPSVATAQYPLRVASTAPATVPNLRAAETSFAHLSRTRYSFTVSSPLGGVLDSYNHQASDVAAIVGVVALQLILLTLFVLYVLVARTAVARRSEVALAKLRGASLASLLVMGISEPALILLLALPIGLILAFLAIELASGIALHGAPVPFSLLALLAGLAAFASGLVAIVAGSRRLLSRPLVDELRAAEEHPSQVARAAWEGAALALAAAGLLELGTAGVLTGSNPNPIALFAPGLIAVGMAVPGARLLPVACAFLVRRTRYSRFLGTGMAVRQAIRRPAALRQVLILTVAVALSAFAIIGWSVAGTNRTLRADFDLGAARVVQVSVPQSVNLVEAVRRADPSGRYAMAAMESKQANAMLLAVDVSRLRRVAYWPRTISRTSVKAIVNWLNAKLLPPLLLTGTEVRLTADLSPGISPPPDLVLNLLDSGGNAQEADFGYLGVGSHTYTASLPSACAGGCRVTSLSPVWTPIQTLPPTSTNPYSFVNPTYYVAPHAAYSVTISGMGQLLGGTFEPLDARIYRTGYWGTTSSHAKVLGSGSALTLVVEDSVNDAVVPGAVPGPLPRVLHAVSTDASQPADPVTNTINDFDGTPLRVNSSPQVVALPSLGDSGDLMSLSTAMEAERGVPLFTKSYVWLAPGAPSHVLRRLVAEGLTVESVSTPAATISGYNAGGLGLGYQFFVFAAAAAAALAVATTVLSFFLSARRRAFELAVLRALGVPNRTLRRSLITEQALVLIPGLLLGIAAAVVAGVVALPSVPEFGSNSGQPPLDLSLPALPLLALGLVFLALLVSAAVVTAQVAVRRVDLTQLRMEFR
ncbi:MAG: ABC transporter permease [Candidatus Dormibacteria bacterium]